MWRLTHWTSASSRDFEVSVEELNVDVEEFKKE
jgi:hypothetical protein